LAITESQQQQIQPEIVTVILPVGNTHVNQVETMESLVLSLEQRLQNRTDVIAVDMAQLSIREQVLLLLRTKVLVTNQGGGSYVSLFLPRGSTVLLFHHKSGERYDVAFHEIGGQYKLRWIAPTVDPQSVEQAVDFVSYALAQPMTRK
jgi:capsular polysaccharide biosynthesis protein